MLKKIKNFLKKIDYFGVQFNFQYESNDKYHTILGGIVFLIFMIISFIYISVALINLLLRKNISIIYYKMQIPTTDAINFDNYTLTNAFSVVCSGKDNGKESNYFTILTNKVSLTQYNGEVVKEKTKINYSFCQNSHFYNKFNKSVELYGLNKRYCFTDNNITIQGLYTDEIYKYVEITVLMTKTEPENYEEYYNLLTQNDCSFQIYFTNFVFDLNNYKNPVRYFIGNKFIKLEPNYINKMELYFLAQRFDSYENYLFDNFHTKYFAGFSDDSTFSLYKGSDRLEKKPDSYSELAKFFLRADSSLNVITRKYMKLTEFAAGVLSLLKVLLIILNFIFTNVNKFYSNESIMKKIHQFKGINSKNEKIIRKIQREFSRKEIEQISKIAEQSSIISPNKSNLILNQIKKNVSFGNGIQLKVVKDSPLFDRNKSDKNIKKFKSDKNILKNEIFKFDNEDSLNNKEITISDNYNLLHTKNQIRKNNTSSLFGENKKYLSHKNGILERKKIKIHPKKKEHIIFKFNICELFVYIICPCCMCKKLKMKINLTNKGNKNIYFQLDILTYIKNNQTLEILTYILLEPYQRTMLKFLSKPSISLVNKINIIEKINEHLCIDITDDELNEFLSMFKYLQNNIYKNNNEQRLFQLVNVEMNNLLT